MSFSELSNPGNKQTAKEVQLKAAVIGWPISHSRSPLIHGFWLNHYGINGTYEKIAVEPENLETFIGALKAENFSGLNLTIPHKEQVFHLADEITDDAKTIGAANTLWFEGDKLIAGNTDAYGFITHLKKSAENWQKSRPALVIGAGGAARAIIHALIKEGVPEIKLTNRTLSRAEELASNFGPKLKVVPWQNKHSCLAECSLIVNSSSLGMEGNPDLEIDLKNLQKSAVCYDIVYAPLMTPLLKNAQKQGATPVDGLGMLLHQAVPGFEKWFGKRPEVTTELRQLIVDDLQKDHVKC